MAGIIFKSAFLVLLYLYSTSCLPMTHNLHDLVLFRGRREAPTTPENPHEGVTMDPENPHEGATMDPDLVAEFGHGSSNFFGNFDPSHHDFNLDPPSNHDNQGQGHGEMTKGEQNPLLMSRPGESPPLALPMTSGDTPVALAQTGTDLHPEHQGHSVQGQDSQGQEGITHTGVEGTNSLDKPVTAEGHDMPIALPMTGGPVEDAPVALAQKQPNRRSVADKKPNARTPPRGNPGNQRAAPNWQNKPRTTGQGAGGAPKGSVGNRIGGAGGRQAPNWASGPETGTPNPGSLAGGLGAGGTGTDGGGLSPMEMAAISGGDGMGGFGDGMGGGFGDMMEMQRKMMFDPKTRMRQKMMTDPRYQQQYFDMMQKYRQQQMDMMSQMLEKSGSSSLGSGNFSGFQYNPLMMGMGGDEGMMGMGGNMGMNFMGLNNPLCTNNPDSPICKMQAMGMGMETQIEGPFGEMDMEPGELDIEGPMAHMLLKQLSMGRPNVHPLHQEITLNHHVLGALQRRFGVNTTAGIQQKSHDPQFQAFMFQVLKKSGELAPGEFNANLSQAEINAILAGLEATPVPQAMIASSEFAHASLENLPAPKGAPPSKHDAILSIDSGMEAHSQPQFSPLVGQLPLLTGLGETTHGTYQALVQDIVGTAGEGGEAPEKKGNKTHSADGKTPSKNGTVNTIASNTTITEQKPSQTGSLSSAQTGLQNSAQTGSKTAVSANVPIVTGTIATSQNNATITSGMGTRTANGPEKDIMNKDAKSGLSKDFRTRNQPETPHLGHGQTTQNPGAMAAPVAKTNLATNTNLGTGTSGQGAPIANTNPGANTNLAPETSGQGAANFDPVIPTDTRPTGLKEAGIFPGSNASYPTLKKQTTYATSTAFAITAIVLIALAIIIGPIICMLCKMKEKRDQNNRKIRALKNREVSENNIIEAMMLHDLGTKGRNFVENEAAMGGNYYKNDRDLYQTIDPELEPMNHGRESPTGRLP